LLESLEVSSLSLADQARLLRERGAIHLEEGQLLEALPVFEQALVCAQASDDHQSLGAAIAQSLGFLEAGRGHYQSALRYLTEAVQVGDSTRVLSAHLTRATVFTYMGNFDLAQRDLNEAHRDLNHVEMPLMAAIWCYATGILCRFRAEPDEARQAFARASELVVDTSPDLYAFSQAHLASIATMVGDFDTARMHMMLARDHALTANAKAMCDLRQGQWLTRQGQSNPELLECAVTAYRKLHQGRDMAFAALHWADSLAAHKQFEAMKLALEIVADVVSMSGGSAFLRVELDCLSYRTALERRASRYAKSLFRKDVTQPSGDQHGMNRAHHEVCVLAFGDSRIEVDGLITKTMPDRAFELLVFVLLHPNSTLNQIVTMLDPDGAPCKVKNLFHQLKYVIAAHSAGLMSGLSYTWVGFCHELLRVGQKRCVLRWNG
jgi:tetratricopeptide (TPR) repeat protein